jgi:hypothetical protein
LCGLLDLSNGQVNAGKVTGGRSQHEELHVILTQKLESKIRIRDLNIFAVGIYNFFEIDTNFSQVSQSGPDYSINPVLRSPMEVLCRFFLHTFS